MFAIVVLSQENGKRFNKPKNEVTHIIGSHNGQDHCIDFLMLL